MKRYQILALTDHRNHSDQNSLYPLLRGMHAHQQCELIYVASRGFERNSAFFQAEHDALLFGSRVNEKFEYSKAGDSYLDDLQVIDTQNIDILFLRLPRPVSDEFLVWLNINFSHSMIINDPIGIIETSSKAYLLKFPELCPSMSLCKSTDDVLTAAKDFPIVLKPLKEYGGKGILKIDGLQLDDGKGIHNTEEYLERIQDMLTTEGYLSMKYLKNVTKGDKRILIVDGEVMTSVLRIPADGSWLCNIAQGGKAIPTSPTKSEHDIIHKLSPYLKNAGIFMYGIDTLMNDYGERILSEINTLSIGGFISGESKNGNPLVEKTVQKLFRYADGRN